MATNLALDDKLIDQARIIGQHRTKREAVNTALKECIAHKKQQEIAGLFGKVDFDRDYDYKKTRTR